MGVSLLLAPVGADKRGPNAPFPLVENAAIQLVIRKRVLAGAPAGAGSSWKHCYQSFTTGRFRYVQCMHQVPFCYKLFSKNFNIERGSHISLRWFSCEFSILVELKFGDAGFWEDKKTREPRKKTVWIKPTTTNNKLNSILAS